MNLTVLCMNNVTILKRMGKIRPNLSEFQEIVFWLYTIRLKTKITVLSSCLDRGMGL